MAPPALSEKFGSAPQSGAAVPPVSADAILESINDAFYAVDGQWRFTYLNRQVELLWGRRREELIGRRIWEAFPEATGTDLYHELQRCLHERRTVRFETVSPILQRSIDVSVYPTGDGISVYFRDISERKQIEHDLRRSRDEFATAIGRITDGFGTLDRQWRITFINGRADAIFRKMQRVPGELIGRNMWEEFPDLVGSLLYREYHRAVAEQVPVEFQISYPPLDGWFELNAYPSADGLSVYFRDITERKQAEAALHESEERFRAVFDRTAIGLAQADLCGRFVLMNGRYCEITGYSRAELLTRTFLEISHADDVERNREQFRRMISGEVPTYQIEKRYVRPDDRVVWVHVTVSLLRDAEGRPQYVLGAVQEITEQKRAAEALRESESRYRFLIENTSDAVWRFDLLEPMPLTLTEDEQIEWGYRHVILAQCNHGMARIYGYERAEQMVGLRLAEILPGSDLINLDFLRRFIRSGYCLIDDEAATRASDGSERIVLCNLIGLVRDGRLCSAFGNSRDVTQKRKAERALRESEERLRDLNRTLEHRIEERTRELRRSEARLRALALELTRTEQRERRRLSLVLHDHVQQLLVGAQMHLGVAAQKVAVPEYQQAAHRALDVIQEALRTCRSLAVELSPPLLHEQGLGPALAWLTRRMRENYRLPVEFASDPTADAGSEELKELLFQAARELLLNVVKHARAGTARLQLTRDAAQRLCLEVEDDGIGFDPEAHDVQARSRQSFGLFHIRERLLAVGGALVIDSRPGRGTRVRLSVPEIRVSAIKSPAIPDPTAPPPVRFVAPPEEPARRLPETIRVLLVDDHAMVREGLIAVLERQPDFQVVGEAVNGQQAVEVARDVEPDVVLMDVSLPGINGIAATHHITMTMPDVRVIGLSAHEEEAMGRAMVEAGAVHYLTKGGPSEELVETIRAVTRQRETVRSRPSTIEGGTKGAAGE